MGRYALIVTATGAVDNVIEYDGSSPFTPPTGMELREADNNAEIGGSWNGSAFVRAVIATVPTNEARTRVLMGEVKRTTTYDEENSTEDDYVERDKTADEIAAEKLELKNLLLAELQDGDLSQERTQTLLRLERE
jgi:hypothetical protein